MTRTSPVLLLLLASATVFAAGRHGGGCATVCTDPGVLRARLHRIASLDWRQIDWNVIKKEWPETPPPPTGPLPGGNAALKRLARDLDCCCKAGKELAGPGFEAPPLDDSTDHPPGLWGVEVMLCRPTKKDAVDALKGLIDAVAPEHPETIYTNCWSPSEDGRGFYEAAWDSHGERLILKAGCDQNVGLWQGWFELRRRRPAAVLETWNLDDGSQVRVLRLEMEQSRHPPERKALWFAYLSDCLNQDLPCWSKEIVVFWPGLRARAEREGANWVSVRVEDGAGASTGVHMLRGPDGTWSLPSYLKF